MITGPFNPAQLLHEWPDHQLEINWQSTSRIPFAYEAIYELYLYSLVSNQTFLLTALPPRLIIERTLYTIPEAARIQQAQKTGLSHEAIPQLELDQLFSRLGESKFRSSFKLRRKEQALLEKYGWLKTASHAADFIQTKLQPAQPVNDGSQTPMKNHPVFLAAHATGTCCRGCLEKWHGFVKGQPLSPAQINYILIVQLYWLRLQSQNKDISL